MTHGVDEHLHTLGPGMLGQGLARFARSMQLDLRRPLWRLGDARQRCVDGVVDEDHKATVDEGLDVAHPRVGGEKSRIAEAASSSTAVSGSAVTWRTCSVEQI
jgi:hypothetical protein